jgi:dynein heavy chain
MEGQVEVAGEDREEAVQSPSRSGSIAQEDQPLQQLASPRAAEGASEAPQAANSDSAITSDSEEPVLLVKRCTVLGGLTEEKWAEDHYRVIRGFLSDPNVPLLLLYIDPTTEELCLTNAIPPAEIEQASYFVRANNVSVSGENFHQVLRMGMVHGNYIPALLRVMQGIYAPSFFENRVWPDTMRNEFSGQLHKFMARLTDAQHKVVGHTVLYVPDEGTAMEAKDAHTDKDLVQRLEVVVIHWTRQIKELLSSQESLDTSTSSGPLEEIEFWRARCEDYSSLTRQLDQPGVKKVTRIVQRAKSSYVEPFQKLSRQIQDSQLRADNCLKFISLLQGPCEDLKAAEPSAIPALLPRLLTTIRIIWNNSEHYKSRERLNGLLRRVSSDIIKQCCQKIVLDDLFEGRVEKSKAALEESLGCCHQWKVIYTHTSKVHNTFSNEGWVLDESSIFAEIDAFIQRCKDLMEVAEGQIHFGRWCEGKRRPIPCFGGCRGPEVTRTIKEIEHTFSRHLSGLKAVRRTILDVQSIIWHDEYLKFRTGTKELEVMVQNLINGIFSTIATVQEGVEILEIFSDMDSRELIRRVIDKQTVELYAMFTQEINQVKREFSRQAPVVPRSQPHYASLAAWARLLKRRIDTPMKALEGAYFLHEKGVGEESQVSYQGLAQSLDEFIGKTFSKWADTVDRELQGYLERPLMNKPKSGMLTSNFNKTLQKLLNEMRCWERLRFEIPHFATSIYQLSEQLRVLRESVLLIVRDYNRIIGSLQPHERALFKERIRSIDKKIRPGMVKLTWASEGILEYVTECRLHAQRVRVLIDSYKASNRYIAQKCREISTLLMVRVTGKKVYEEDGFRVEQEQHCASVRKKLHKLHDDIYEVLFKTAGVFTGDGGDVMKQVEKYAQRMDMMVEEALRLNVKWSLQELARAISSDGSTTINPLFKVKVKLTSQIEFSPSVEKIVGFVLSVPATLTATISLIKRLPERLKLGGKSKPLPIHKVVKSDEEVGKIQAGIESTMAATAHKLTEEYPLIWKEFKMVWEAQKDVFFRRWRNQDPKVVDFDSSISQYIELSNKVQQKDTITSVEFVLLDCSALKYGIIAHCDEWQNRFHALLHEMASNKLNGIYASIEENTKRLKAPPETLDQLGDSLLLLDQLQGEMEATENEFEPLQDMFKILSKYEVMIPEADEVKLEGMPHAWVTFQQCLIDSTAMLKKHKEKFRTGLLNSAEDFKNNVGALAEEFETNGPFSDTTSISQALAYISSMREQLGALKAEEDSLRKGLGIFKIEQSPSHPLQAMEKDLDYLEQIWDLTQEWEMAWDTWKGGTFQELQTDDMGIQAQSMLKKLTKLAREVKDKVNWTICGSLRGRIETFKMTMPLIQDLKNPAMRDRHWLQLQEEVQKPFDHASADFTLEKLVEIGLDQHAELVGDISSAASKELAIEQAIQAIADQWKELYLEIPPHKDRGHFKLKASEELFQILEDNQVTLSTMKASRYVKAFEKDVDYWERTLSHILEVIEMVLQVQRQWMYLDNIFIGEDIRKQLPNESADFDGVNAHWKTVMTRMHKDNHALRATHHEGLLELLNEMNTKLEAIQKSLDMYLETKRQCFPRFYFLSNDDLLEILGQSKNPEAIQPHLKKCFDNIKTLDISRMLGQHEATHMNSSEGEKVQFKTPVRLEGVVEGWLCVVEDTMHKSLKEVLRASRLDLKKHLNKREKWVREWPGQVIITASQIQWTADCEKALDRGDKKGLKSIRKKQGVTLDKFSEMIRGNLSKMERLKLVALVTIEVHARDIIEKLLKAHCESRNAFEWQQQLRFYWEDDDCAVRQTNTLFHYGYEYLGNSGRLVITPLTDRCYITLTTALHLHRGGSPKGPAGTGKTETVKDLGKGLGMYVIVINCSEGLDYKSMGRMFSGLAQAGAWGCFDEFNRINIEVLSVVAQQILSILQALGQQAERLMFEGHVIKLTPTCGVFITMNPGYAGRTELPDNLKSMFRPIAMIVPDSGMISEIVLFGEGFLQCKVLARKVNTLYRLAVQQLSKQDHYDFGLRALVSVLKYGGRKKRGNPDMPDEEVLLLAMKDMNIAKLTAADLPLFNGITADLFPGVDVPILDYGIVSFN